MNLANIHETILEPIIKITHEFIDNENNIKIIDTSTIQENENLTLQKKTIYFKTQSDNLDFIFAIWYDDLLENKLMRILNFGEILPEEENELKTDTAKEVGNIIFGNAISYFLVEYANTTLSTPMVLDKNIDINTKNSKKLLNVTLKTEFGDMIIYVINPQSAIT